MTGETRFLSAGPYRVVVEHSGFKTFTRDGVTVSSKGEMGTVDIQRGASRRSGPDHRRDFRGAEMLSTGSATIVRALDRRELDTLPTSARNFTQLLVIEPGVSADISELLSNDNASISPSVNGARTTNNSFVYNGIDVTSMLCCNSRINGSRGTIDEGGLALAKYRASPRDP